MEWKSLELKRHWFWISVENSEWIYAKMLEGKYHKGIGGIIELNLLFMEEAKSYQEGQAGCGIKGVYIGRRIPAETPQKMDGVKED